jgi:hypothetical protein
MVGCSTPEELKNNFSSLDNFKYKYKYKWHVIDVAGNNIRLVVFIEFSTGKMFVKHIINHSDYEKLCERYAKGGNMNLQRIEQGLSSVVAEASFILRIENPTDHEKA